MSELMMFNQHALPTEFISIHKPTNGIFGNFLSNVLFVLDRQWTLMWRESRTSGTQSSKMYPCCPKWCKSMMSPSSRHCWTSNVRILPYLLCTVMRQIDVSVRAEVTSSISSSVHNKYLSSIPCLQNYKFEPLYEWNFRSFELPLTLGLNLSMTVCGRIFCIAVQWANEWLT